MAQQGLERIPYAVGPDFRMEPVRARFPEQSESAVSLVPDSFIPDAAPQVQPAAAPKMSGADTLSLIGRNVWDAVVYHTPAAIAAAIEGDEPYKTTDWKDSLIERSRLRSQETAGKGPDAPSAIPGVSRADINSLGPSLGFSAVGAGAGLGAGVPAAIAGNVVAPGVGTVAGYGAGMLASGKAAFNMATNSFVRDLHDAANEESLKATGKPIKPEDFAAKQSALSDVIRSYGLWEAVPEAAGNALSFGILTAPVKGAIGKLFGSNIATRLASKMGALYGEELATETVTQTGQHNAEVAAGLTKAPERSFTSPQDLADSFKEVAPSTILQTTLMAGGFKAGQKGIERLRGRKAGESGDNDNAPASNSPQPVEGTFIPADRSGPPAATQGAGGDTFTQDRQPLQFARPALPAPAPLEGDILGPQALPAGQAMLPPGAIDSTATEIKDAAPAPTLRQQALSRGLLTHSKAPSPDMLKRLMRVDDGMAQRLYDEWASAQTGPKEAEPASSASSANLRQESGIPEVSPLEVQAHAAATSPFNQRPQPTDAQKKAGNYAKGHVRFHGMDISIENPAGSVRSGTDEDGKAWETTMQHHYGYIKGTVGRDKDHLDVFIKPGAQSARTAYVIDQTNPKTGAFDEHKIILGADSEQDARAIYQSNYQPGWNGLGAITAMPIDEFKAWIDSGKTKKPIAYVEPKGIAHPKPSAKPEAPAVIDPAAPYGKVGIAPFSSQVVGLKDNGDGTATVMRGEEPFYDFENGDPITVPTDATAERIRQAVTDAGALSSRDKWFGVAKIGTKPAETGTGLDKSVTEPTKPPEQDPAADVDFLASIRAEFRHEGFRIYPVSIMGEARWAVQSLDNAEKEQKGERQIGGDAIVDTAEQAKKQAEDQVTERAEKAERQREFAKQDAADEAKREANRGLSITERRANAALDKPTNLPVNAGVGRGSRREAMESAVSQGRAIVAADVPDTAAYKRDEDEQGRLHRAGYGAFFGNDSHPQKMRFNELTAKLKNRDNYQKKEYRLYNGRDTDGGFYEITKTEYDYAKSLMTDSSNAKPVAAIAGKPVADMPVEQLQKIASGESKTFGSAAVEKASAELARRDEADSPKATKEPWQYGELEYGDKYIDETVLPDLRKQLANAHGGKFQEYPSKAAAVRGLKERIDTLENHRDAKARKYYASLDNHYGAVRAALADGKPVPPVAYESYDDLKGDVSAGRIKGDGQEVARVETPQHIEAGQAEPATAPVIAASIKESATNTPMDIEQARGWLLSEIDKAIIDAKSAKEEGIWNRADDKVNLEGIMDVGATIGFKTFNVPGDGKFRVLNLKESLQKFKKQVAATPGFKKNATRPMSVANGSGGKTSVRDMLDDGEYVLAVDYGHLTGKPLLFGAAIGNNAHPVAYTDAEPVDIGGVDAQVGREWNQTGKAFSWRVIETTTGAMISSESTKEKAISKVLTKLDEHGVKKLIDIIKETPKVSQAELERQFTDWGSEEEARAQKQRDALERADTEDRALWNSIWPLKDGEKRSPNPWNDIDRMQVVILAKDAAKASKGDEFVSLIERRRGGTNNVLALAARKALEESGKPGKQSGGVDYKGFERTPTGNGNFTLKDGNLLVKVEAMGGGKFQASHLSAKSSPHIIGEQGAVDWAANLRDTRKKTTAYPFYSNNKLFNAEGTAELPKDWTGVAKSDSGKRFFYLGQENGERSFNPLKAESYEDALKEADGLKNDKPVVPEGYREVARGYFGGTVERPIYAPFAEGDRVRFIGGHAGNIQSFIGGPVTTGAIIKYDNGLTGRAEWRDVEAVKKPSAEQEPKNFKSIDTLNAANNPLGEDDWIRFADGSEWQVKGRMNGWALVQGKTEHPTVKNIMGQVQFIRAVVDANDAAQATKGAEDTALTVKYGGSELDIDLGKPAYQVSINDVEAAVRAKGYSADTNPRTKFDPMQMWRNAHATAVAKAAKDGKPIPARVLYDYRGLIRNDLNDELADLAADKMVEVFRDTKDYEKAVQAYRDFGQSSKTALPASIADDSPDAKAVDYKGFRRVEGDGGTFYLEDGNMRVKVDPQGGGKFQASFRGAKSSPHIQGEQGAVDWAANYRGDGQTEGNTEDAGVDKASDPIEIHADLMARLREGTATLNEFKAGFAAVVDGKTVITEALSKLTKDAIFERFPGLAYRYKNDKKAEVIDAAYRSMLDSFAYVGNDGIQWTHGQKHEDVIRGYVDRTTEESLRTFAADAKAAKEDREARQREAEAGMENPVTLDDYKRLLASKAREIGEGATFGQARMAMTPEQRARYDELSGEASREQRQARADQQTSDVRAPTEAVGASEIIKTKHTKHGHDLWQFTLERRVPPDEFKSLVQQAKKMGGDYSSYRGNGAIPGWQFRTEEAAIAFRALVAGDTTAAKEVMQARRDAFADDRTQSAAERLEEMAAGLDERADESLSVERKANTARRARMAAGAEAAAQQNKAMARTMRNIADKLRNGSAKFLDRVRQKVQVEMLDGFVTTAKDKELSAKYDGYAEQEKHRFEPATAETADYSEFPAYTFYRSDLASLGRQMLEHDGTKKLGAAVMRIADDVSAAYTKFAKENLHKVALAKSGGGLAAFPSRDAAEAAIRRSGFKGKAIVLPIKRGENAVVMSPSEASERGIWTGDPDKRLTLPAELGDEIAAKTKELGRLRIAVPWMFERTAEQRKRLKAIGIETPAEFRAALREFIAAKSNIEPPSRIKELERKMVGRKNDGLDFFPTPAGVAQRMVESADIQEGMAVLEPSAGMGHIAEAIREAGVDPDVMELSGDRRELLDAKGFNVIGSDFMDISPRGYTYGDVFRHKDGRLGVMRGTGGMGSNRVGFVPEGYETREWVDREDLTGERKAGANSGYDRILMNPPFSERRDAEHVRHAYTLLRPGGRIVAIMGEGVFFGQDKKAQAFRDWLDEVGGTSEKLEEGTFLDPSLPVNTGVNARLVVIDKPQGVQEQDKSEGDAGAPRESRAAQDSIGTAGRLAITQAKSIVAKFLDVFKRAADLDIRIVASPDEIPTRYRPSRYAEGVYHSDIGTIWLVTDNLMRGGRLNALRVFQVLLHEAVGHHGLAAMMGDKFKSLKARVLATAKAKGPVVDDYYKPGDADYATVEAVRLRYPGATDDQVANEVLARMAETDPGRTLFGYVRAVVRQWLRDVARKLGIQLDTTVAELNDLVALASAYMRRGAGMSGDRAPSGVAAASLADAGLESRARPGANEAIWDAPDPTTADNVIYTLQDKHIDLKRVQQAIKEAIGAELPDQIDPYLQEELFHGRAAKATEEFLDRELQPLIGEMKQRGITMDSLETYLWARHAGERNAQIAKINPDMPDGGSGLTDRQARDVLAGKDVTVGGQAIKGIEPAKLRGHAELARKIDMMVAGNRLLLELYELETPSTLAAWKGAYQHYVPLHREDVDSPWAGQGTGQGYSVRGASTKRATGSYRPVENILANLVMQRKRIITRGEKNRVAQALYGLAKSMPNPDFWKVDDVPKIRVPKEMAIYHVMDGDTEVANYTRMSEADKHAAKIPGGYVYQSWGERVVEQDDPLFRSRPNVVWARFGGEDRFVIFNERDERAMRLAGALKNLDADDISHFLGEVSRWTRYFASINTQYNPVFGVVNLTRDTGTGLLNLKSTPLEGKQAEMLGHVWQALPAIYRAIRIDRKGGTPAGAWAELWEEFQEVGGQTGYRDMFRNATEQRDALDAALDPKWWQRKTWGKVISAGGLLAPAEQALLEKAGKPVLDWLSDYNTTMENAIRLSAYKVARDHGMSRERAASLAKNLTVNFNRKGQAARQLGALYAFFNASVQGTARMLETLTHGRQPGKALGRAGKQIVYGGLLLGSMQAMWLAAAGFDDDEPPEFVRDRAIIIPLPDKRYLSVPLPLGFHVLPALGRIGTEQVLNGFKAPGRAAFHVLDVMADAFNPIGNAGMSMQTLAPTVLDPAAALAENKDWTGKQIYRENFSQLDPKPGHQRTKDTATALSKWLSQALNSLTGGTEFQPGGLSPTPDQIDYLIGQVTGGVGREVSKLAQTGGAMATGEELPAYKIPLLGRFYGDAKGQAAVSSRFYENLKAMAMHQAEFMGLAKSDRGEQAKAYLEGHPEASMFREADRMQRYVGKLQDEKRKAIADRMPSAKVKEIDAKITEAMHGFNARVAARRAPAVPAQ